MHPGVVLGAALLGGGLVVGGAYATTTHLLSVDAPSAASTSGSSNTFLVAVCTDTTTLRRVSDQVCGEADREGEATAAARQAWRYLPSSMSAPVLPPKVGARVSTGSFIRDPAFLLFTADALDVNGLPPVQDRPTS